MRTSSRVYMTFWGGGGGGGGILEFSSARDSWLMVFDGARLQ